MAFCENCGAKLTCGVRFCEECGAEVSVSAISEGIADMGILSHQGAADPFELALCLFQSSEWQRLWSAFADASVGSELGIIVTREKEILHQIGDVETGAFRKILLDYIAKATERNVRYAYCDLDGCTFHKGGGKAENVVASLRRIVEVARPKYLFILGNEDVIDVVRWENLAKDGDEVVESDLCYSTLDVNTPFGGQVYDFDEVMRVGRLPSRKGEGLESYSRYFKNAFQSIGTGQGVRPYGLSALEWEGMSNYEYNHISEDKVDVSPAVTTKDVGERIHDETNLLFFNLHGSNDAEFWYGQSGSSYPEAFAPNVLDGRDNLYFIGVEACYGARYLGGLDVGSSVMLMAMRNKCLAFLGASRIAFGAIKPEVFCPEGSCADVVIGDYIRCLVEGSSAGDAHIEGLRHLSAKHEGMNDSEIKTLAEFALYGDPAARMPTSKNTSGAHKCVKSSGVARGLFVPQPDVRRSVQMALAEVDSKIEALVDEFVMHNLLPEVLETGLDAVRQSVFKMTNTGLNQKRYSLDVGPISRIAKVYFDDNGKIHEALVSK